MSIEQSIAALTAASNKLTDTVSSQISSIQRAQKAAEDSFNQKASGFRSEFPYVNLLRNARATDKDSKGNLTMPLTLNGVKTAEVVEWSKVPADIQAGVPWPIKQQAGVSAPCNGIHLTYGDSAPNPGYFLAYNAMSGETSCGIGHLNAISGSFFSQKPGKYNYLIVGRKNQSWNIDFISNPAPNTEVWIFQPFVVAGYIYGDAERILTITNTAKASFGL